MAGCSVRITALGASADSRRQRQRLEELAIVLGAKVAQQSSRWAEITHIVCVMPEHLDRRMYDAACRKKIPVVTVQWLFDCFGMHARQPEDRYSVAGVLKRAESQGAEAGPVASSSQSFT